MTIKKGSKWLCTEDTYSEFNKICEVIDVDNNPDYNGDNDIEVKYEGDSYTTCMKLRRFQARHERVETTNPKEVNSMPENQIKKHLRDRTTTEETTINAFLEEMSAFHITEDLKQHYQHRVQEALQEAQRTEEPQVVMGEGDLFFIIHPNSIVSTAKIVNYYDLLTEQELKLKRLEHQAYQGEITYKEYKQKKEEILKGTDQNV